MGWQDDPIVQPAVEPWRNDPVVTPAPDTATLPEVVATQPEGGGAGDEHDLLYYKTGKTKSEREALNAPLREAMQVPAVAPETISTGLRAIGEIGATSPEDLQQGPVQQGINESIAKAISGMTTGEGAASLPLYMFPPTAVGLQAESTADLPAQVQDAIERARQGDIKGAASTGTDALLNALMTAGVVHGGAKLMGSERAPIPLRAEPTIADTIRATHEAPPEPPPPVEVQQPGPTGFSATMREPWQTPEPPVQAPEMPATVPEAAPTGVNVGDTIQWTQQAMTGEKTFPTGKVTAIHQEPGMKALYEVEGQPDLVREDQARTVPEAAPPLVTPAQRNGQILAERQELLNRQKDLKQRFINGEHGVAPELEAVEAEIKASPVVHAPPAVEQRVQHGQFEKPGYTAVDTPQEGHMNVPQRGDLWYQGVSADGMTPWVTHDPKIAAGYAKRRGEGAKVNVYTAEQVGENAFADLEGNLMSPQEFAKNNWSTAIQYQGGPEGARPKPIRTISIEEAEGPVNAQEAPPIASEAPGGVPVADIPPEDVKYAGGEPQATSTKNVVTAAEREARGIPPAEEAAARDFGTVWDESAKDTAAPARLVAALKVEPRALSDVENAHLLRRQIELQTEHDTMTKAVNEATDPAVAAEAKQRLETVRNDLQDVYDVGKAAGTETGRGLNARKMLADQDYALANMEATTRALVNDGKPLSEAQLGEVAKLHERIRTAEDKLAAYESQEIFNQSLKAAPRRPVLSFLDEQAVKARERINARRNRLYADPLGVTNVAHLADEAIIGASHIARGVTKFADWSAQMVSEFGDRIKPYLAALFEKSKQQFKAASAGLKKTPMTYAEREARALAGEKKGIITRTEKLIGRTEVVTAGHPFGEFEPLKRSAPRMDPEKAQLQYEYSKAKEAFDRGIYEAELKKRSVPERILGTAREVLNLPRSLLASADLSAVRRQGGIYTMIHPLKARHAFMAMLEATKSEQGYFKVMQEIRDRPNAPEYQRYGLELTDIGPMTRAKMEEQFQSRWANKIPGISHSQRAYTGFLNRARADWFDLLKDSLAKKGEPLTPKQGKAIANAVNVFTGRGAMNQKWIGAMTALNDVFFAPRWRASRFQTLIGQPLWKNSGARGVIAKEYAKALIGYGSILTLIGWATKNTLHPMEKNPVSTEAGKLRIGNTRIDFLQGLQQPTVLLSRLLSGRTKTAAGEVQKIYGDVPLGKTTSSDIITRFLRSSLAPVPSGVWNTLEQKNVIGEPVTLPSTVRDLTIPLLGKDIYDAMKEQGATTGTALGLLALFGDGIQTYSPRVNTQSAVSKEIQKKLGGGTKHQKSVSEQIKAALEKP